jgi:hypothetical protein
MMIRRLDSWAVNSTRGITKHVILCHVTRVIAKIAILADTAHGTLHSKTSTIGFRRQIFKTSYNMTTISYSISRKMLP